MVKTQGGFEEAVTSIVQKDSVSRKISRAAKIDRALGELKASGFESYISGLSLTRSGTTGIIIGAGGAYVRTERKVIALTSAKTLTGLDAQMNAAQRFHYLYLYADSDGNGQIEFSQSAPSASAYAGNARNKVGDQSRRYLGSLQTVSTPIFRPFRRDGGGWNFYQDDVAARRPLVGGTATANTAIDCSWIVPAHVRIVWITVSNNYVTSGGAIYVSRPGSTISPNAAEGVYAVPVTANARWNTTGGPIETDASQQINYAQSVAGMSGEISVVGFYDPV